MKLKLCVILLVVSVMYFIIIFFPEISFGGELYSAQEVETMIEQQTDTVGLSRVLVFDQVYEDRGNQIKKEIIKTKNRLNFEYKKNIFDCEDMAMLVDGVITARIAKNCGNDRGALMLGSAFINFEEDYHAVTLFVASGVVYLYDYQENIFSRASKCAKNGIKFTLILI